MIDLREEIINALEDKEKCEICGSRKNVVNHNPSIFAIKINICSYCHRLPMKDFNKVIKR